MTADEIVDGIYTVRTAMDTRYLWDISGASQANKANLQIYTQNNGLSASASPWVGNHQRFKVETIGNLKRFVAVHSGKVVEVYGRTTIPTNEPDPLPNRNCSQFQWNGGHNQLWRLSDATDSAGDECVEIMSSMNTNYVMDSSGAIAKNGANIFIKKKNSGDSPQQADNQKWVFERSTIYDPKMPVPYSMGALQGKSVSGTTFVMAGDGNLLPVWLCSSGNRFQARYQVLAQDAFTGEWTAPDTWESTYADEPGEQGWGDEWADSFESAAGSAGTGQYRRLPGTGGIPVSFGAADRVRIRVGVRRFEPDSTGSTMRVSGPVAGGETVATYDVVRHRNLTLFDVRRTAEGISVRYEFDGSAPVRIGPLTLKDSHGTLADGYAGAWSAMAAAGTLLVPADSLARIPANNTTVTATAEYTYSGVTETATGGGTIAYDASWGLEVTCTAALEAGWQYRVTVPQSWAGAQVYLLGERDGQACLTACTGSITRGFMVAPVAGETAVIDVVGVSTDNQWGEAQFELQPVSGMPESYVLSWDAAAGAQWCQLPVDMKLRRSGQRDCEAVLANDSSRETVFFGTGASAEIQISGSVLSGADAIEHSSYTDVAALLMAGYATLRTPSGERMDVAVTGVDQDESTDLWRSVTVTCRERQ